MSRRRSSFWHERSSTTRSDWRYRRTQESAKGSRRPLDESCHCHKEKKKGLISEKMGRPNEKVPEILSPRKWEQSSRKKSPTMVFMIYGNNPNWIFSKLHAYIPLSVSVGESQAEFELSVNCCSTSPVAGPKIESFPLSKICMCHNRPSVFDYIEIPILIGFLWALIICSNKLTNLRGISYNTHLCIGMGLPSNDNLIVM